MSEPRFINWEDRSANEATIVCLHIVETLQDGQPRGFEGWVDEEGGCAALCGRCSALSSEEWDNVAVENSRLISFEQFVSAASKNGIISKQVF